MGWTSSEGIVNCAIKPLTVKTGLLGNVAHGPAEQLIASQEGLISMWLVTESIVIIFDFRFSQR
jgi:hypothetical protein